MLGLQVSWLLSNTLKGLNIYYVTQVWLILLRKGLGPLMMEAKRKKVCVKEQQWQQLMEVGVTVAELEVVLLLCRKWVPWLVEGKGVRVAAYVVLTS